MCLSNCHRGFVDQALSKDMLDYIKPLCVNEVRVCGVHVAL